MTDRVSGSISDLLPYPGRQGGRDMAVQLEANYDELRRIAAGFLQTERRNHTLQPTALVHEAYLRLASQRNSIAGTRTEFLAAASTVMRWILVDYARCHRARKRGSEYGRSPLAQALRAYEDRAGDLLALNDALQKMAAVNDRMSRIVELRFFGGMTMQEIADHLDIPLRTVERGWTMARAWLKDALSAE